MIWKMSIIVLICAVNAWPHAQCQTSLQKLTERYLVDFGFEGVIWATVTRKKIFSHLVINKQEKIWWEVGKIAL